MSKLLSAGNIRLRKSKVFWLGVLFMFGFGIFMVVTKYSDMIRYDQNEFLDDSLFLYVPIIGCCCAVFCSLFLGTEYSDGTIRNKVIIGHTRKNIYCANLLICITATLLMAIAFLLSYCTLGAFLLKAPQMQVGEMIFYFIISLFTMIAFTSLFNMLSMLITKKSISAVACLLIFIGLLIVSLYIMAKFSEPEFIFPYNVVITPSGSVITTVENVEELEMVPNPKYLKDTAKAIYQFFYDFLPSGQSFQLYTREVIHPFQMIVYSMVITVITSVGGILAFNRKDLK